MTERPVEVALALVVRNGLWLVARRPDHVHLGGMWEFPGGKIEPGEDAVGAALRELREECAVEAEAIETLSALRWDYDDRRVRLVPVFCRWRRGEARPIGSVECRWVSCDALRRLHMPAVNDPLIDWIARHTHADKKEDQRSTHG